MTRFPDDETLIKALCLINNVPVGWTGASALFKPPSLPWRRPLAASANLWGEGGWGGPSQWIITALTIVTSLFLVFTI